MPNNGKDYYYDVYLETKLTADDIRQYEASKNLSDDEVQELSDKIFDLAIAAQKIILETNE